MRTRFILALGGLVPAMLGCADGGEVPTGESSMEKDLRAAKEAAANEPVQPGGKMTRVGKDSPVKPL